MLSERVLAETGKKYFYFFYKKYLTYKKIYSIINTSNEGGH